VADLELTESVAGAARIVGVRGDVDLSTSERFGALLQRLAQEPGGPVVVDLTECVFIDSSGLAAILHAAGRRDAFSVVGGNGPPADVLRMTGVDQTVAVYATLQDALAAA
jgi:anti-anti-sigma factor